jgi:short-subunit dehydrogenase
MKHNYKWAFITGATSGLGEEFAKQLPTSTNLLLTGRNKDKLEELKKELSIDGRVVEVFAADIGKQSEREKLAQWTSQFEIDLFINNAGFGFYGPVTENTPDRELQMVEVNVAASTYLGRVVTGEMVKRAKQAKRPAGMIVVSSVAGFMPLPYFTTYAATKAFNLHYAEGMAQELAPFGIDVLALCPGPTKTGFGNIAGMGKEFDVKSASAADVVRGALNSLGSKHVYVHGVLNRISTSFPRLLPRRWVSYVGGEVMKKSRPM